MAVQDLTQMIDELRLLDSVGIPGMMSPKMKEGAKEFLGIDFSLPNDYKDLADSLTQIRDGLANMTADDFRYNKNLSPGTCARYNPGSGKIELGDRFFNSPLTGNDTKQGTLVHETAHKVLGVNMLFRSTALIEKYDMEILQNLPVNPTNKRAKHANSWEYFYEYVKNGGKLK